ncbi:hypothetical protein [Miniphocaeibacter halophilus]|uniref:Uncharacterized protein n=1 Tax=Miniphocaeibacter halophilus TaxID=2931922 RepID=A0AC61MPF9_9FIRM|nr:hypothetical protein [Miniphocaeibacter halophilus]QQK07371.1 hypothetical protein JFY71_08605 [Miniphocaeibacter halophilus]
MNFKVTYKEKDGGIQAIINYKVNGKWKQKTNKALNGNRVIPVPENL